MDISKFLAMPGRPHIRMRVGPGYGPADVVAIDQQYFDEHREELTEYCRQLELGAASNWRAARVHTDNNGLYAKLLISMGDLLGVWSMNPPRDAPEALWTHECPRVFMRAVEALPPTSLVPKPSRGDFEADATFCTCCHRHMGPTTSVIHDLTAAADVPALCVECAGAGCVDDEDEPCKVFTAIEIEADIEQYEDDETGASAPSGMDSYLKQFE